MTAFLRWLLSHTSITMDIKIKTFSCRKQNWTLSFFDSYPHAKAEQDRPKGHKDVNKLRWTGTTSRITPDNPPLDQPRGNDRGHLPVHPSWICKNMKRVQKIQAAPHYLSGDVSTSSLAAAPPHGSAFHQRLTDLAGDCTLSPDGTGISKILGVTFWWWW